jgi:PHD-finger
MAALLWVAKNKYSLVQWNECVASSKLSPSLKASTTTVPDEIHATDWTDEQKAQFRTEIFLARKNFRTVARAMKVDVGSCLEYYYSTYKGTDDYLLLKTVRNAEEDGELDEDGRYGPDLCGICGDGGDLLICDACDGEFHMECMRPALASVPAGRWFCDECTDKRYIYARDYLLHKTIGKRMLNYSTQEPANVPDNVHMVRRMDEHDHTAGEARPRLSITLGSAPVKTKSSSLSTPSKRPDPYASLDVPRDWQPNEQVRLAMERMVKGIASALSKEWVVTVPASEVALAEHDGEEALPTVPSTSVVVAEPVEQAIPGPASS